MKHSLFLFGVLVAFSLDTGAEQTDAPSFLAGERVIIEAHNCYPYQGRWEKRLDDALAAGVPLGIELDLCWDSGKGGDREGRLIVAHGGPFSGKEPLLRDYFFERVRPIMEEALQSDDTHHWPLITLNINDIRGDAPGLHRAVYDLIRSYEPWLCTAPKGAEPLPVAPITLKPMLILAGGGARERAHFYDAVPVGGSLFIFGSGNAERPADNFRRWINYSWRDVEPQGQPQAGAWTEEAAARLNALVSNAHKQGYWIRFYGLDGRNPIVHLGQGGNPGYNFGSLEAVQQRWKAAVVAGVDFIATDQIQDAVDFKKSLE